MNSMIDKDIPNKMIKNIGPILFRLVWWNSLDPQKRNDFKDDLLEVITISLVRSFEENSKDSISNELIPVLKMIVSAFIEENIGDFSSLIPDFTDATYESVIDRVIRNRDESEWNRLLATQYDSFMGRICKLSDKLINTVKLINEEFMIWMQTHPDHTVLMHQDAFEQITGERLTSEGYEIAFTGRIKNKSADLMALQVNEEGEQIKYLVECKRYSNSAKIGLGFLNAVIGASYRAKTSHAILATTSSFTKNIVSENAKLNDYRIELHDGKQLLEWLSDYKFKEHGLWLPDGWQDSWEINDK